MIVTHAKQRTKGLHASDNAKAINIHDMLPLIKILKHQRTRRCHTRIVDQAEQGAMRTNSPSAYLQLPTTTPVRNVSHKTKWTKPNLRG